MPSWALTLAYTLHMAATVAWIGGLFFQSVFRGPALRRTLDPPGALRLLELLRRRFDPLAWLSLAVLIATGLTQMNASPSYEGFLALQNPGAGAILAKHGLIALMVALAGYQTLFLYPWLSRLALRPQGAPEELALAERRQAKARPRRRLLSPGAPWPDGSCTHRLRSPFVSHCASARLLHLTQVNFIAQVRTMALTILLWLGVLFLSFGFCGVFGTLLRRARHGSGSARAPGALFRALVILPSAAMVLGLPGFALPARFAIVLGGALVGGAACTQPGWAPDALWTRSFARAYFAAAMGITALWELGLAFSSASVPSSVLAAPAGMAGAASLAAGPRPA